MGKKTRRQASDTKQYDQGGDVSPHGKEVEDASAAYIAMTLGMEFGSSRLAERSTSNKQQEPLMESGPKCPQDAASISRSIPPKANAKKLRADAKRIRKGRPVQRGLPRPQEGVQSFEVMNGRNVAG